LPRSIKMFARPPCPLPHHSTLLFPPPLPCTAPSLTTSIYKQCPIEIFFFLTCPGTYLGAFFHLPLSGLFFYCPVRHDCSCAGPVDRLFSLDCYSGEWLLAVFPTILALVSSSLPVSPYFTSVALSKTGAAQPLGAHYLN